MTEAARGHPPNLQARLAEVATRLDTGDFTPADIRTLAAAADDVRGVRARVEDALDRQSRGELTPRELQDLGASVRRWRAGGWERAPCRTRSTPWARRGTRVKRPHAERPRRRCATATSASCR